MSTKNRVLSNLGLTLCLFGLVTLKIIIWRAHDIDLSWVIKELGRYLFLLVVDCGIFLSAFFALVTIWLPAKGKFIFGFIALRISSAMGFLELGAYLFLRIMGLLIENSFDYTGLDPLLTAGVIAVIYFAMATSDGFDIAKSKKNENKSQWLFFPLKKDDFLNGNERCYPRREIREQKPTREDNGINIEKIGKRLFAAAVAAIVVSASCLIFISSDTAVWRISFVCMLIGGLGLFVGVALLIFDHIRK